MTTPLLTVDGAAAQLQVSKRFVLDELRRRNLRGIKTAAGWRVKQADLNTYIEAHATVRPVTSRSP